MKTQVKHELSENWIKASVVGTTWAASEIVLGSFLHNLKVPFSSIVLTGIGLVILISTSYIWKDRGLIWRAGLICALMKTMSPSAVIFGPMIAIFSQAALLEFSVRVLGKTIPGYVAGAMLAMSWNLFQKIMNLLILYGFNIVEVYAGLLRFARMQLHIQFDIVWLPVLALLLLYCLAGLFFAVIGIRVGRKLLVQPAVNKMVTYNKPEPIKHDRQDFDYSASWLFLNFIMVIAALVLINYTPWMVWSVAIPVIVLVWVVRYKRALRRLSKPGFWVYFVIITMATAFVFNKMQGHSVTEGLLIGIRMNLRAVVIILGFSVLGTELYNPKIRGFFLKTSFKHLPLALELSFQSLPLMISAIPGFKALMKNPVSVIYQIVSQIEYRLDDIKRDLSRKMFIVAGAVGQGKTTQLQRIIETLKTQEISVGGVLSPRIMENEITMGYDVIDIGTGERTGFLRETAGDGPEKIGKYAILPAGLEAGLNALNSARENGCRVVVVDEVGKLELAGKGWAGPLDALVNESQQTMILTVRDSNAETVQQKWNIRNCTVYDVSEEDPLRICEAIMLRLSPRPSI